MLSKYNKYISWSLAQPPPPHHTSDNTQIVTLARKFSVCGEEGLQALKYLVQNAASINFRSLDLNFCMTKLLTLMGEGGCHLTYSLFLGGVQFESNVPPPGTLGMDEQCLLIVSFL